MTALTRPLAALAATVALLAGSSAAPSAAQASGPTPTDGVTRPMVFPVLGSVRYGNDWGAPRGGGTRSHQGNDLMGTRLQPLLAAADGQIRWTRTDGNNMFSLEDADGWEYWYIHVNNDTPGTDDGANPADWALVPQVQRGSYVMAGQHIGFLGDSGNAEGTSPHLHFELHGPDGVATNPFWSLRVAPRHLAPRAVATGAHPDGGHYVLDQMGGVHAYGDAPHFGQPQFPFAAARDLAVMPDGRGYVVLDAWGGVHRYGSARNLGLHRGYFAGLDVGRSIDVMPGGDGYVVLDSWGGLHTWGTASQIERAGAGYWPGWDIARSVEITPDGKGLAILDGWGGMHFTGTAKTLRALPQTPYWVGWDEISRDLVVTEAGYAVLDGWGGVHGRGTLSAVTTPLYRPGSGWRSLDLDGRRMVAARTDGLSEDWDVVVGRAPRLGGPDSGSEQTP